MKKTIKLQNRGYDEHNLPMVPNFIRRVSDEFPVPIGQLSDSQLKKIGKAWTDALIEKAYQQRERASD